MFKQGHTLKYFFKKGIMLALFLSVSLSSCGKKSDINNTISISGAFALYPMAVKWAEEYKKIHPDIQIHISAGGAGKGMTDALSGMVDLGMVSRSVSQEEIDKGAWFIAVTKDAVLPTINSGNTGINELMLKGLKKSDFAKIFLTGEITDWDMTTGGSNKEKINVFTRSDACGAGEMWAKYIGKKQEDLKGTGVFGDPGMADAIRKDKNSIGYNNIIYIYDINTKKKHEGLEVVPVDINENGVVDETENFYETIDDIDKAIKQGKYPSPPARDLYFVSKGKPVNKATSDFLKWILLEGQKFVKEGGYVELQKESISSELKKLE